MSDPSFLIIGAGPAGLAAAHEGCTHQQRSLVLESENQVGGLSKTIFHKGYGFDVGGHRFFTRIQEVNDLWKDVLPEDFLQRSRLSRIYYRGRFFRYPLHLGDAMFGLGIWQGVEVFLSFVRARLSSNRNEVSFEDWVSNRFGKSLFRVFFKSYTEKVWGVNCGQLSADWAAQRIRDLNLSRAVLNAFGLYRGERSHTLAEKFDYPRRGPGQMYEAMARRVAQQGSQVLTGQKVVKVRHENGRIVAVAATGPDGPTEFSGERFISSMPVDDLIACMDPAPPKQVLDAAANLRYRGIITANLIIDKPNISDDNWIYLHAAEIRAGRMQLYKNWSPDLVPNDTHSSLGLEYFTSSQDDLWTLSDEQVIDVAVEDLQKLGFATSSDVVEGLAVRYDKAYPVYDVGYETRVNTIREYLAGFANLICVGRAGLFRYNNMDHSVYTGMLAVRRFNGSDDDPWDVNLENQFLG